MVGILSKIFNVKIIKLSQCLASDLHFNPLNISLTSLTFRKCFTQQIWEIENHWENELWRYNSWRSLFEAIIFQPLCKYCKKWYHLRLFYFLAFEKKSFCLFQICLTDNRFCHRYLVFNTVIIWFHRKYGSENNWGFNAFYLNSTAYAFRVF